MKSTTPLYEISAAARAGLSENLGMSTNVLVTCMALLVGVGLIGTKLMPLAGFLLELFLSVLLMVGTIIYFLAVVRCRRASFSLLFAGFNRFGAALCTFLLITLRMVPFLILIELLISKKSGQPAVGFLLYATIASMVLLLLILQMRYGLALYVVADDPSIRARQAICRSVELMKGNYLRLGLLWFRFTGWILIAILRIEVIWLVPFFLAQMAAFYDDLSGNGRTTGLKLAKGGGGL